MSDRLSPLAGRRALITGASRGIGRSIAVLFAQCGADVILVARDQERLDSVADEISPSGRVCAVFACDVTADDAADSIVAAAEQALGGVDILVNNAGGNSFTSSLESMRLSGWDKTLRLNLDSVVRLTHAALPVLVASGNASIINVSSVAGVRSAPFMSHYGAAKAALISLTRSLAVETAQQGVRVNALVPRMDRDRPHRFPALRRDPRGKPPARCTHGPVGSARGDRRGSPVPGQRRIVVRHRTVAHRRRRPDHPSVSQVPGVLF